MPGTTFRVRSVVVLAALSAATVLGAVALYRDVLRSAENVITFAFDLQAE